MDETAEITVTLTGEQLASLRQQVAAGRYGSLDSAIGAAIDALQDRDTALADWLRAEVAPAYDAMMADPSQGIPAETVFEALLDDLKRQGSA